MASSSSMDHQISAVIAQLGADTPQVATQAARTIKNAIIANPTNKRLYLQHGVLTNLISCASRAQTNPSLAEHAVAALGSLSSFLSPQDILPVTIALVQCLFATNTPRPVFAAARAIKLLVCSPPADVQIKDIAALVVAPQVTAQLVLLLATPDEGIAEVCATIISHTTECDDADNYARVYIDTGAIQALVTLLARTLHERCLEACINALTALAKKADDVSRIITTTYDIIHLLMPLTRTPIHSLRLATCRLLTTFHNSGNLPEGLDINVTTAVVSLLTWSSHDSVDIAAKTLSQLVSNSSSLQRIAMESGAIAKLADILLADYEDASGGMYHEREKNHHSNTSVAKSSLPSSSSSSRDVHMSEANAESQDMIDEEEIRKVLRGSALMGLSAVTQTLDIARDSVISKNLLPVIVDGLTDESAIVVEGSIECIRSLSRSVKILRKDLSDETIGKRVVSLLNTPNKQVLRTATAALCNLVLEFSPVRKVVLEMNGIKTVIDLLKSEDEVVRKNCVWVLKNMLFKADMATKNGVLSKLGHDSLRALFSDEEPKVRAVAMTVVRNLACSSSADTQNEQLDSLFAITGVELISMLSSVLSNESSTCDIELVIQALYVVCNIASGTEQHKGFLLESDIPQLILQWTCHSDDRVRVAAVWCAINLSWRDRSSTAEKPTIALTSDLSAARTQIPTTPPPRRHTRAVRRALRGTNRSSIYEGRFHMMLRRNHLPMPASPGGRRILERYTSGGVGGGTSTGVGANVNTANANTAGDGARIGSVSSDGGNDDMWLIDNDAGSGGGHEMMDEDAAGDIDGTQSESNQSEDSNENNNNSNNNNDSNNLENASLEEQRLQHHHNQTPQTNNNNDNQNLSRVDEESDLCPSGYEASGSGGVDGSAGEGDHSGSNSSSGKSCGYEWRIERLRQLGFEGRLRSLINDPHIEVQGRARAALQLFDSNNARPVDSSSALLTDRSEPSPLTNIT